MCAFELQMPVLLIVVIFCKNGSLGYNVLILSFLVVTVSYLFSGLLLYTSHVCNCTSLSLRQDQISCNIYCVISAVDLVLLLVFFYIYLPSPPLSERKRYCDARRLCMCLSAEPRLRATLVSTAKVMRCIQCSLVCHLY